MIRIKKFLLIALLAVSAIAITGCGSKDDRNDITFDEDGKIVVTGDAVEVNFWGWGDKEEVAVFTRIVNSFNKK